MTSGEKWSALMLYLNNTEKTILIGLKTSSMGETPNELRAFGAQLALIGTILTQAERLDRNNDVAGRPSPPVHKY